MTWICYARPARLNGKTCGHVNTAGMRSRVGICCESCGCTKIASDLRRPPIAGDADREYQTRLDAERVTLEFASKSTKRLDVGKEPIESIPLFGGSQQEGLF